MRCPACNAENLEGAVTCTSCGAAMGAAAATAAPAQPEPAAKPRGRRLSWFAVVALIAAAIGPWPQVLMVEGGGKWFGEAAAANWRVLMVLEYGAYALFVIAAVASLIALGQVLGRQHRRGGALAVGALLLAVGGVAGAVYGPALGGRLSDMLASVTGASGRYAWPQTVIIVAAALVCEIVLLFVRTPAPAAEAKRAEAEPAKTA